MGILNNRLSTRPLTELTETSFVTDVAEASPRATKAKLPTMTAITNTMAVSAGKESVFDAPNNSSLYSRKANSGLFRDGGELGCLADGLAEDGRYNDSNRDMDRLGNTGACLGSEDVVLTMRDALRKKMTGVPDPIVRKLEGYINTELVNYDGLAKLGGVGRDSGVVMMRGMEVIRKVVSPVGGSINTKLGLKTMFRCSKNAGYIGGDSLALAAGLLGMLLAGSYCVSITKSLSVINELLGGNIIPEATILEGMFGSKDSGNSADAITKLGFLGTAMVNSTSTSSSVSGVRYTGKLLQSLSGVKAGKNAGSVLSSITSSMGSINPGWDKDSAGELDLSRTAGNAGLSSLSDRSVVGRDSYTGDLGIVPPKTTDSVRIDLIRLVNNTIKSGGFGDMLPF